MNKKHLSVLLASAFLVISSIGMVSCKKDQPKEPEHVHTTGDWLKDDSNHWHECSECHETLDKSAHTFNDWTTTLPATCETDGKKERTCTVCNYKQVEVIPKLNHLPSETWEYNETDHWHTCTREGCDDILDKAAHTFSEWKVTKESTCLEDGKKERTCSVCGYKEEVVIPKLNHLPSELWEHDENEHWHVCTREGCTSKLDKAAHTYGDWEITKQPTCSEVGSRKKTCSVCGYELVEDIPINAENHAYGSHEITKEPTLEETGEVTIKCLHNPEHVQKVTLPNLSAEFYLKKIVKKDADYNQTYYIFNTNSYEKVKELFVGTLLEGTETLNTFITESKFAITDICLHQNIKAEYLSYPTNSATGQLKVTCPLCNTTQSIYISPTKLNNYNYTILDGENLGKAEYSLSLTKAKDLFETTSLNKTFSQNKTSVIKAMTKAKFIAPLYDLNIEVKTMVTDETTPLTFKIFTTRDVTAVQYDVVDTQINLSDPNYFDYEFVATNNCKTPVEKYVHIKVEKAAEFAENYLNQTAGQISKHPDLVSKLSSIRVGQLEPTYDEIEMNIDPIAGKHTIGDITLKKAPDYDRTGMITVKCKKYSNCGYEEDFAIPVLTDTSFYEKTESAGSVIYTVTDFALNNDMADRLSRRFAFAMNNQLKDKFKQVISFTKERQVRAQVYKEIDDTRDTFFVDIYANNVNVGRLQSSFTYNDVQYFTLGYEESNCNNMQVTFNLNDAGAIELIKGSSFAGDQKVINALKNLYVGAITASDVDKHNDKTIPHTFEYVSHKLPTGLDVKNGEAVVRCTVCGRNFTVNFSTLDVYDPNNEKQTLDIFLFEEVIKTKYPELTDGEARAFAKIFENRL